MKKQGEQKTKGHKTSDYTSNISPSPVKAEEQLDKQKIASLKDKNAAKMKKGKH
jgi:hypothetical protein